MISNTVVCSKQALLLPAQDVRWKPNDKKLQYLALPFLVKPKNLLSDNVDWQ